MGNDRQMEICDACNGAGGDNQHSICGKCDGVGGYPTTPTESSIVPDDEGLVEQVRSYRFKLECANQLCDRYKATLTQQAAEIEAVKVELARRDANETRNCLNWGPCSRHDGRMSEEGDGGEREAAFGAGWRARSAVETQEDAPRYLGEAWLRYRTALPGGGPTDELECHRELDDWSEKRVWRLIALSCLRHRALRSRPKASITAKGKSHEIDR